MPTYKAGRKYQSSWEQEYPWVKKAADGSEDAFCKLCRRTLQPKASILAVHSKSADHVNRVGAASFTRSLVLRKSAPAVSDNVKKSELELAAAITCHSAIVAVDHFGEIISCNAIGCKLEKIRLHHTKCCRLITEVISPAF